MLRFDAASTGLFGVLMLVGAPFLSDPLGLPVGVGPLFAVAHAGRRRRAAGRRPPPRHRPPLALTVVGTNAGCRVAMVVLALAGVGDLTGAGVAFLLVGAVIVAGFAEAQFLAYRRDRAG
ncbi:hypothetical protein RM844_05095 [Streptomyces sp. DSM 44915]|uniref:Uncharacterized protein n=1 Tax=Streptomyces chisholmiae TaxID=3075540 RepID=A0ABU2JL04_9ACTN|nr:hypothetical protein [Streptomyces sp. DSM 44915]MDT0265664.1 hypothetical protein [Streptomyces sp. DSM 44915]